MAGFPSWSRPFAMPDPRLATKQAPPFHQSILRWRRAHFWPRSQPVIGPSLNPYKKNQHFHHGIPAATEHITKWRIPYSMLLIL
jgi:hypothetical protein